MSENTYSLGWSMVFWLLWSVGILVLLLFGGFLLIIIDAPMGAGWKNGLVVWNGLVVLAEGFLLFKTARHFVRKDKLASELLLLVAVAAFGVPLLATGGCLVAK